MHLDEFKKLVEIEKESDPDRIDMGNVGSDSFSIQEYEKKLGVQFCELYKGFLGEFGWMAISDDNIAGIVPRSECQGDVIFETKNFLEIFGRELPNHTVLINESDEWYVLVNHENKKDGCIVAYDPFSKSFQKHEGENMFSYLKSMYF